VRLYILVKTTSGVPRQLQASPTRPFAPDVDIRSFDANRVGQTGRILHRTGIQMPAFPSPEISRPTHTTGLRYMRRPSKTLQPPSGAGVGLL
jgi:hypothetical protein